MGGFFRPEWVAFYFRNGGFLNPEWVAFLPRIMQNDVLLMGDFNLGPEDSGFQSLKAIPNMIFINSELPT